MMVTGREWKKGLKFRPSVQVWSAHEGEDSGGIALIALGVAATAQQANAYVAHIVGLTKSC
jgi:hypothetical protein